MWLELDEKNTIVGIHSHQCQSPCQWVEYTKGRAQIGDRFENGKVFHTKKEKPILNRQTYAESHILKFYSLQEQILLTHSEATEKVTVFRNFIREVQNWIKSENQPTKDLESLKPQ